MPEAPIVTQMREGKLGMVWQVRIEARCACCNEFNSATLRNAQLAGALAWAGFPVEQVDESGENGVDAVLEVVCVDCEDHKGVCQQ